MNSFTARFRSGNLNMGVIVTPLENNQKFKVQMVTGDRNPIILTRSDKKLWLIDNPGKLAIANKDFQKLGKVIDAYLNKIYSMKTILILTDFSEAALNAAKYGAALTHQLGTPSMILYHSYEFIPIPTDIPVPEPSGVINFHEESIEHLNDLKNTLQSLVNKKTTIEIRTDERPLFLAEQLITEQQHAGLVIMGITGKSNLEELLVGSNTVAIAKECTVPLLVVPKEAKFENIRNVLFACDLKKVSKSTPVNVIKTFIHAMGAKLFILNVDHNDRDHFDPDIITQQAILHDQWDSENPEYHYTDHEDTAEGIMQFADEHDIQLVITVPKKYDFFESLFHRSVTKKLAFHTHIPLLLLKEDI